MATITSATSGNFNNTSTWVGGVIPTSVDTVILSNNHRITLTQNEFCHLIIINVGSSLVTAGYTINTKAISINSNIYVLGDQYGYPSQSDVQCKVLYGENNEYKGTYGCDLYKQQNNKFNKGIVKTIYNNMGLLKKTTPSFDASILLTGLRNAYNIENNLNDSYIGTAMDYDAPNQITKNYISGKNGQAMQYTVSNGQNIYGQFIPTNTSAFTVNYWTMSSTSYSPFALPKFAFLQDGSHNTGGPDFSPITYTGTGNYSVPIIHSWNNSGSYGGTYNFNLVNNEWFMMTYIFNGATGNFIIYRNGVLVDNVSYPTFTYTTNTQMYQYYGGGAVGGKYTLDAVTSWTKALTEAEVIGLYNNGNGLFFNGTAFV